jgi:hypothetical protein
LGRVDRVRAWLRSSRLAGEPGWLLLLVALVLLVDVLATVLPGHPLPVAAQTVPVVLAGLLLELRLLRWLLAAVFVAVVVALVDLGYTPTRLGSLIVVAIVALLVARGAVTRERLGVVGVRGDSVLADLRDRLAASAGVPELPPGWHADVATALAGGLMFGGDVVLMHAADGVLQVLVLDVSGSGAAAATRALQLSGAFGGLVGAVPPERLLPAANDYLLRQGWDDGFATAAHLTVDTATGEYALRSAGHPPPARFRASDGTWNLGTASGPALGLIAGAEFAPAQGRLGPGDALLAYTDGLVESAGEEIEHGIARLLGAASSLVVDRFAGGSQRLLASAGGTAGDDRAVVLVWRD